MTTPVGLSRRRLRQLSQIVQYPPLTRACQHKSAKADRDGGLSTQQWAAYFGQTSANSRRVELNDTSILILRDRVEGEFSSILALQNTPDPLIKSQVGTRPERNINEKIQLF